MAFVSWRFVEQPFRRRQLCTSRRAVFIFGFTGMCILAATAYYGHIGKLQPVLNTLKVRNYKYTPSGTYVAKANLRMEGPFTFMGDAQASQRVLLAGDSHSQHLVPLFIQRAQEGDFFAVQTPLGFADKPQLHAEAFTAEYVAPLIAFAREREIGNLVLANRWAAHFKGFTDFEKQYEVPQLRLMGGGEREPIEFMELEARLLATVRVAQDAGLRVWIVTGIPEQEVNVPNFAHKMAFMMLQAEDFGVTPQGYAQRQDPLPSLFDRLRPQVEFIEPAQKLCTEKICRIAVDGVLLYSDDDHLSVEGTIFLRELFESALNPGPMPSKPGS